MSESSTKKTIVITGASDGIGAASARQLAAQGHRLLLVGRSKQKIDAVAHETGATAFVADFARFDEVRALARRLVEALGDDRIDVLANNAGGIFGDRTPTIDGNELTFQVNHLSPFLLTHLLLPSLRASENGRRAAIVNTSSTANRFGHLELDDLDNTRHFSANKAYGDAKLANILFTRSLHAKYHARGISSVAFHPGVVRTSFASDTTAMMRFVYRPPLNRLVMISPERGGKNLTFFAAGTPDATWQSGAYYSQTKRSTPANPQASDAALAEALWVKSAELVEVAVSN